MVAITELQEKQDITVINKVMSSFVLFHGPWTTSKEKGMSSQKDHNSSCKLLFKLSMSNKMQEFIKKCNFPFGDSSDIELDAVINTSYEYQR